MKNIESPGPHVLMGISLQRASFFFFSSLSFATSLLLQKCFCKRDSKHKSCFFFQNPQSTFSKSCLFNHVTELLKNVTQPY
jgi:hypothetical protein